MSAELYESRAIEPTFELYASPDYFEALHKEISTCGPGDRVAMLTMSFKPADPLTAKTLDELENAAKRGADVALGVDAYSFMLDTANNHPGPLWLPGNIVLPHYRKRYVALDHLQNCDNATTNIINAPGRPFSNPYAGRSHLKLSIVNNKVFVGGSNLDGTDQADLTVCWEDEQSADALYELTREIVTTGTTKVLGTEDWRLPITADTDVLFDVGVRGQSTIFQEALRAIDEAQQWIVYSGQFFPKGAVRERATEAHERGVNTMLAYNHPANHGGLKTLWQQAVMLGERKRTPSELLRGQTAAGALAIHAAGLATEREVFKGSHNYVETGIRWGTPEIVLHSRNSEVAHAIGTALLADTKLALPSV